MALVASDIGSIRWLSPKVPRYAYAQRGLPVGVCNHPCVIIDSRESEGWWKTTYTICVMTSFSKKSYREVQNRLDLYPANIPILPNQHYRRAPAAYLELENGKDWKRESWVRYDKTFSVPKVFLEAYPRENGAENPKLTQASVYELRQRCGLPPSASGPYLSVSERSALADLVACNLIDLQNCHKTRTLQDSEIIVCASQAPEHEAKTVKEQEQRLEHTDEQESKRIWVQFLGFLFRIMTCVFVLCLLTGAMSLVSYGVYLMMCKIVPADSITGRILAHAFAFIVSSTKAMLLICSRIVCKVLLMLDTLEFGMLRTREGVALVSVFIIAVLGALYSQAQRQGLVQGGR